MDSAQITLSPSVAEAISRGAVVEQLRGRDAFHDDDDASSVCTPAPDDGPRLSAEAAAAAWQALAAAADLLAPEAAAGLRAPAASPAASFLGFFAAGGSMAAVCAPQSRQ